MFIIDAGNYGATAHDGSGADIAIGRKGTLQIADGATLTMRSLEYALGDGSVNSNNAPITAGVLQNLHLGENVTLPAQITVSADASFTNSDFIKIPTGTSWTVLEGGYNGSPALNTNVGSGIITWELVHGANDIKLRIAGNSSNTLNDNTLTTLLDASNILMNQRLDLDRMTDTESFLPDYEGLRSGIRTAEQVRTFYSRFKSLMNGLRSIFSKEGHRTDIMGYRYLEAHQSSKDPLAIISNPDGFSLWFGSLLGRGHSKQTHLTASSHDHQEGLSMGMEWRNIKKQSFTGLNFGFTHSEATIDTNKKNYTHSKTGIMTIYHSEGFSKEGEWDVFGTFAKSNALHQRVARPTTMREVLVHSKSKSDRSSLGTQIGYKFKWRNPETQKSHFSLKPFTGILYAKAKRNSFMERDGGDLNIRYGDLSYESFDSYIGLGVRKRIESSDYTIKATGEVIGFYNMNHPKVFDSIYLNGGTGDRTILESPSLSRKNLTFSLTISFAPTKGPWKFFLKGATSFQDNRKAQSLFVKLSYLL